MNNIENMNNYINTSICAGKKRDYINMLASIIY